VNEERIPTRGRRKRSARGGVGGNGGRVRRTRRAVSDNACRSPESDATSTPCESDECETPRVGSDSVHQEGAEGTLAADFDPPRHPLNRDAHQGVPIVFDSLPTSEVFTGGGGLTPAQDRMDRQLREYGLDVESGAVMRARREALEAVTLRRATGRSTFVEVPDHEVRLRAADAVERDQVACGQRPAKGEEVPRRSTLVLFRVNGDGTTAAVEVRS